MMFFLLNETFNEPENNSYITTIHQDEFGLYDINGIINNETVILKTIYYFPRISFVFFRDLIKVDTNEFTITVEKNVFHCLYIMLIMLFDVSLDKQFYFLFFGPSF